MQRRYEYIQTSECLGMSALAECVHERNLNAKADAEAQFRARASRPGEDRRAAQENKLGA